MATTIGQMSEAQFLEFIQSQGGRNNSGKKTEMPDIAGLIPGVNGLKAAFTETYSLAGKLSMGTATASDFVGSLENVGKQLPVVNRVVGIFGDLGRGAFAVNNTLNDINQSGVNYRNDLGLFMRQATGAGMSLDNWGKYLTQNSESLARMGITAGQGAQNFGKLSEMLLSTSNQGAENLRIANGATQANQELTESLMLMMSARYKVDMSSQESMQHATAAATSLAVELDSVSKLTGKSKEALQKDMKAQMDRADIQITLTRMSREQQESYGAVLATMQKAPENVRNLFSEMVAREGRVQSAAGRATFAAMGPEGTELSRLAAQIKTASPEERAKLQSQADQIIGRLNDMMLNSQNFANAGIYSNSAYGEAVRQMQLTAPALADNVKTLNSIVEQQRLAAMTPEQREAERRKIAAYEREGKDEKGATSPGAIVGQAANQLESYVKQVTVASGRAWQALGNEIGGSVDTWKKLNQEVGMFKPLTQEKINEMVNTMVREVGGTNSVNAAATKGIEGYDPTKGFTTGTPKTPSGANISATADNLRTRDLKIEATNATIQQNNPIGAQAASSDALMKELKDLFTTLNSKLDDVAKNTSTTNETIANQTRTLSTALSGNRLGQ